MPINEDLLDADLAALLIGEDDPMAEPSMQITIDVTQLDADNVTITLHVCGLWRNEAINVLREAIDMLEEEDEDE